MKVKVLFNNCNWTTIPDKVNQIKSFYLPELLLDITTFNTVFTHIPFTTTTGSDGSSGTEQNIQTEIVDPVWYDEHITSAALEYDIVIFFVSDTDKQGHVTSAGIRGDNDEGPIEITIFGGKENDHAYNQGVDMGYSFSFFCCHEIAHALYLLQGGADNTHKYFYSSTPKIFITEINLPGIVKVSILQRMAKYLRKLLGLELQTKPIIDMPTMPTQIYPQKVLEWARSIEKAEGNAKYLMNPGSLKVAPLTQSWGATNGVKAKDGGWIAKFETYEKGFDALCNFLILGCHDELKAFHQARTLHDFTVVYAGNPPQEYIDSIVKDMGVSGDTLISTFI